MSPKRSFKRLSVCAGLVLLLGFGLPQNVRAQESEKYGVAQDMASLLGQDEEDGVVVPREDLSGEVTFPTFFVTCSGDGRPLIDLRMGRVYRGDENGRVPVTFVFENGKPLEGHAVLAEEEGQHGFFLDSKLF